MDNNPSTPPDGQQKPFPEAEPLKPRSDDYTPGDASTASPAKALTPDPKKKNRRRTYRPSHRATFIGLGVVVLILVINAGIIDFVLNSKTKTNNLANTGQVSISPETLSHVGVNTSTVSSGGLELVVDPDALFNGKMTVAGDVSIGGQLKINSTFNASDANLTQLEAGNTSLSQLDVNGNTTLSGVSVRNNLAVAGTTQLQGQVTVDQLLTVDNNLTVTGNLAVGGVLSTNTFSANNLTSVDALTVGGHIIAVGQEPNVGPGGTALGSNGTVGISGNDSAGIISAWAQVVAF
jgi:cytoskeletal protein CcmA (bactofilin family)